MSYNVLFTNDAAQDLDDIYEFIYLNDSPGKAEYVFIQIEKAIDNLTKFPERGSYPNELKSLGIKQYREVYFNPYRLIYQIQKETVYIMLITDGRRDMLTLLSRRLFEVWWESAAEISNACFGPRLSSHIRKIQDFQMVFWSLTFLIAFKTRQLSLFIEVLYHFLDICCGQNGQIFEQGCSGAMFIRVCGEVWIENLTGPLISPIIRPERIIGEFSSHSMCKMSSNFGPL